MPKNTALLKLRNEKICIRYKELYDIQYLRHEKVLDVLSLEFFIEPRTIGTIVLSQRKPLKTEVA